MTELTKSEAHDDSIRSWELAIEKMREKKVLQPQDWTPKRDRTLRLLWLDNAPGAYIAGELHISPRAVFHRANRLNLKRRGNGLRRPTDKKLSIEDQWTALLAGQRYKDVRLR